MRQFVECRASCSAPADWFRLMCDRSCVLRWMSSFFYLGAITLTYFYIICAWTTYKHRPWHLHFFPLLYLSQLVSTSNSSTRVCMLDLASRNNLPNLFHCHAAFVRTGENCTTIWPFSVNVCLKIKLKLNFNFGFHLYSQLLLLLTLYWIVYACVCILKCWKLLHLVWLSSWRRLLLFFWSAWLHLPSTSREMHSS